jgi:hypothetical protein
LAGIIKDNRRKGRQRLSRRTAQADILVCIVERRWLVAPKTLKWQSFSQEYFVPRKKQLFGRGVGVVVVCADALRPRHDQRHPCTYNYVPRCEKASPHDDSPIDRKVTCGTMNKFGIKVNRVIEKLRSALLIVVPL